MSGKGHNCQGENVKAISAGEIDESEEEEKRGGHDKKALQEDEVETEAGRARKREGWWR
jgi:hypothetical protein